MESTTPVATPASREGTLPKIEGPLELLSFGWNLFNNHWKVLAPILILPSIMSYGGSFLIEYPTHFSLGIVGFLLVVVGTVLGVPMMPALVHAIDKVTKDPKSSTSLSLGGSYRFGFRYFWSLILVVIIAIYVSLGSFVLFIVPGVVVWVYISMYLYTLVLDDKRGFSALTESYSLVGGRWLPVLGRGLFLAVVQIVIWLCVMILLFFVGVFGMSSGSSALADGSSTLSPTAFLIVQIVSVIVTTVVGIISTGYIYRMYTSLREHRQGVVVTTTFKKWLIAFLCIGILSFVVFAISIGALVTSINPQL